MGNFEMNNDRRKGGSKSHMCFRVQEGREALVSLRVESYPTEAEVDSIKASVDTNVNKVG